MATYTEHYNLKKPSTTDLVNIEDLNGNSDIIDAALAGKADAADVSGKYTKPETGIPATDLDAEVQASLDKADTAVQASEKGEANGVATLDGAGKVPAAQLPSYVDDVIEGYYYNGAFYSDAAHTTPITAETGKIYVDIDSSKSYRYSGSAYYRIDEVTVDATPTAGSSNPVSSGGAHTALAGKVDKEAGKALSTNDYTNEDKQALAAKYEKPAGGIPASDLSESVQTSLDKAENSLQADLDETLTVHGAAADAGKTGEAIGELKSAINDLSFVDGFPWIKELYINSAGVAGGVTKLHQVYTPAGGTPSYFMRFSNGTSFTGHTEATATPDYGVLTIYSGQTGTSAIYGYAIVDWSALEADVNPVKDLNTIAYNVDFSPRIASFIGADKHIAALEEKTAYEKMTQIDPQFALVSTDYNLDDLTDSANRFVTSEPFFCNGKVRIEVDSSFVNAGFMLHVRSKQSGRLNTWATSLDITSPTIELEYDDTIRVSVFQANGISAYYDKVVGTTCIYTLTESAYREFMRNKIIGSKKIWCFGDSLTAGVITGTTTITESYPYWLKQFLGNENAEISNFGVPGDTAVNMLSVISSKTFQGNCDIAILMIGTNGYMIGDKDDPTTQLGAYYAAITRIIDNGKGLTKIILVNPPKSVRSGVPERWLDWMHYEIERIAQDFNLDCIDLYTFLPFAPDNTTYYSSDKTHFTAIGYYWIAYIVYQYLTTHMTAQQIGGNPTFDY